MSHEITRFERVGGKNDESGGSFENKYKPKTPGGGGKGGFSHDALQSIIHSDMRHRGWGWGLPFTNKQGPGSEQIGKRQ